jgi:hypothetical protein
MQLIKSNFDGQQTPVASRLCGVAQGTRLLTPEGYRPVETLAPGDRVRVLLGSEPLFQPLTWIGRRDVLLSRRQEADYPVIVRRDALADGSPTRDVLLASEHALYVARKLYPMRYLINGRSILFERGRRTVTYWGLQLARHNVLLADNLPVESLLPTCAHLFTVAPVSSGPASLAPGEGAQTDVDLPLEIEVRTALNAVTQLLLERNVKADFAVLPRLTARVKRHVLQDILTGMLRHAILSVVDGHILLTAARNGDDAVVTVTFVGNANQQRQAAELHALQQTAMFQGTELDVAASPDMATTVSFRVKGDVKRS